MIPEDFALEQRKHLVNTTGGSYAFVPPPLPPQIDLGKIATKLSTAERALGELNGAARRLGNPYMLVSQLIRREALTTSAIEGTITTIDNMLLQSAEPDIRRDENAREANNYMVALSQSQQLLKNLPISHRVIKAAHATLLSGLPSGRGAAKRPGEYKTTQNAIGKSGDNEATARYVPPPPTETQSCMDALEAYINRDTDRTGTELIELALVHYQFEAIHPFNDGNGRIGRLLITLMAQQMKLMQLPLLHVSAAIETDGRKDVYTENLFRVSTHGNWEPWITFFLEIVQKSCVDAIQLADEIIALQHSMKQRAREENTNHRLLTIIDKLFEIPVMSVSDAQELCGVSFPTAKTDLEQLAKMEFVTPVKTPTKTLYVAYPVGQLGGRKRTKSN